jgi:hypothetical protein
MFCNRPARRRRSPSENPAHDFDCVRCGRYRVGETAEARMRGLGVARYQALLPKITEANRDGFRLVLPSCFQVRLNEERAIELFALADRVTGQPERERLKLTRSTAFADRATEKGSDQFVRAK